MVHPQERRDGMIEGPPGIPTWRSRMPSTNPGGPGYLALLLDVVFQLAGAAMTSCRQSSGRADGDLGFLRFLRGLHLQASKHPLPLCPRGKGGIICCSFLYRPK